MIGRGRIFKIMLAQHDSIFGFFHKLRDRVLRGTSANPWTSRPAPFPLTLDINLNTEP